MASAIGMKSLGAMKPRVVRLPAQQRLHADDLPAVDVDLGLVVELEVLVLERGAQLALERQQLAELERHVVLEDLVMAAAGVLGGVHRDVRVANEVVAVGRPARMHNDADARPDGQLASRDRHRLSQLLVQPVGHLDGLLLARGVEQHGELVAAEPRQRVAGAHGRGEALGHGPQQLVAGVVAQAVVHLLEAVEVHEQHRQRRPGALGARHGLVEPVAEQGAVRQGGEAVVERLPDQLLLEPHPLGHVARVQHHAAQLPVVAQVGHVGVEVPPLPEAVQHAEHDLARLAARAGGLEHGLVLRVDELHELVAQQLRLGPIERPQHRLAGVAQAAGAEHEHEIRGEGHEAAEVGTLATRGRDQGPGEEQRGEQPEHAEHHLDRDLMGDPALVGACDRPRRVEGGVGGERGEHPQSLDRVRRGHVLARGERNGGDGLLGEERGAHVGEVLRQPALLLELITDHLAVLGRQGRVVVVPGHRRRRAAVQERVSAVGQQRPGAPRVGGVARGDEQHLAHVALGQRALAGRHLEHRRAVLGVLSGADR